MGCFSKFSPESIKNEYYTDLLTHLEEDIWVEGTRVHFIYANKMGEKYLKRYKRYFRDPDIRKFDMQHEQWLFGGEKYAGPVLKAIDEFMEMPVSGTTGKKGVHRRTVYNPSVQYKMVRGLFKMLGVNKMLDKEGAEFEKLLEDSRKKQEKPLKIPYKKMTGFDIDTDVIDGTTCYTVRVKGAVPKKAVLYDLTGFPAMEVFYGTREVMIAYLPDLKRACLRYGVPLTVHIGKGMMHCWGAMEFVPEAKKVREAYYGALK